MPSGRGGCIKIRERSVIGLNCFPVGRFGWQVGRAVDRATVGRFGWSVGRLTVARLAGSVGRLAVPRLAGSVGRFGA